MILAAKPAPAGDVRPSHQVGGDGRTIEGAQKIWQQQHSHKISTNSAMRKMWAFLFKARILNRDRPFADG